MVATVPDQTGCCPWIGVPGLLLPVHAMLGGEVECGVRRDLLPSAFLLQGGEGGFSVPVRVLPGGGTLLLLLRSR